MALEETIKPSVFIGSSRESLQVAFAIQENLEQNAEITVWSQGIFELSTSSIDSLIQALNVADFGIFVLGPDDIVKMREEHYRTPRDNVIFELGLFIGRLGTGRNFLVMPRGQDNLHLPTDLLGITPGTFEPNRRDKNLIAALGPVCSKIAKAVSRLGILQDHRDMEPHVITSLDVNEQDVVGKGILDVTSTAYPHLTDEELQRKTLDFVVALRQFFEAGKRKETRTHARRVEVDEHSDEGTRKMRQQYMGTLGKMMAEIELEYNKSFKVEAGLLRDELLRRMSHFRRGRDEIDEYYELGGYLFVVEKIAADLEKLARVLPASSSTMNLK